MDCPLRYGNCNTCYFGNKEGEDKSTCSFVPVDENEVISNVQPESNREN